MGPEDRTVRSVMIIDDDRGFARSLAAMLKHKGYRACRVDASERGVGALRDPPDGGPPAAVALIDAGLPGGVDLIARLRAEQPALICVLMTSSVDSHAAAATIRPGAYDYFDKS